MASLSFNLNFETESLLWLSFLREVKRPHAVAYKKADETKTEAKIAPVSPPQVGMMLAVIVATRGEILSLYISINEESHHE